MWNAVSLMAQTGQSDAIHSPEACAKTVLSRTMPAVSSIEVVCTVAISCWLKVLRTMSSPLDDRFDPRLRRLYSEEARGLTALDTAPELAFGGDNQVLVERIGMGCDLDPFTAAGDHREDSTSRGDHPHIVLQLRHIFLGRRLFRERPG